MSSSSWPGAPCPEAQDGCGWATEDALSRGQRRLRTDTPWTPALRGTDVLPSEQLAVPLWFRFSPKPASALHTPRRAAGG